MEFHIPISNRRVRFICDFKKVRRTVNVNFKVTFVFYLSTVVFNTKYTEGEEEAAERWENWLWCSAAKVVRYTNTFIFQEPFLDTFMWSTLHHKYCIYTLDTWLSTTKNNKYNLPIFFDSNKVVCSNNSLSKEPNNNQKKWHQISSNLLQQQIKIWATRTCIQFRFMTGPN